MDQITPDAFDLTDHAIQTDPYPYYPILREQAPVFARDFHGKPCWIVSRRKDVADILMDPKTYSSKTAPLPSLLFADPPEHGRLRGMVASLFTRTAVQARTDVITEAAREMFRSCVEKRRFDATESFASPLTITMIGRLLGLPVVRVQQIRQWSPLLGEYVAAARIGKAPSPEAQTAWDEVWAFLLNTAKSGAYAPDGAIAMLAERHKAGELDDYGLVRFTTLLFTAGHLTTTNLIGNSLYVLAHRPGDLRRLQEDESFVAPFIEEVLRTRPSFHRIARITTREVVLHGERIPAGSIVRLLLASANRDPEVHPDGEEFDPDRTGRAHIAFGQGIHSCLGSWLARLEGSIAMRTVASMAATISLDPERPPTPFSGGTMNEFGFERLPLIVEAR